VLEKLNARLNFCSRYFWYKRFGCNA